jgi:hypothetical protein
MVREDNGHRRGVRPGRLDPCAGDVPEDVEHPLAHLGPERAVGQRSEVDTLLSTVDVITTG